MFKTNPIQTGLYAAMVALPKYLIGFTFLLSYSGTALLIVPVMEGLSTGQALLVIVPRFVFALVGIILLAAGGAGYLLHRLDPWERWILMAVGLVLLYPAIVLNVVALAAGLAMVLRDRFRAVPATP